MARVQGPMLSLKASGTFAGTIVFQGRKGSTAAFLRKKPYDTKQTIQMVKRDYMTHAVDYWHGLPLVYTSLWNDFVKG